MQKKYRTRKDSSFDESNLNKILKHQERMKKKFKVKVSWNDALNDYLTKRCK